MAELNWAPASPWKTRVSRLIGRYLSWEDWLTLGLCLGTVLSVSLSLEAANWSRVMPALAEVGALALLASLVLARSPLSALRAWPMAALAGMAVAFWQAMMMVGPGSLAERLDAIHFRFQAWFELAYTSGITNDSLPFNVSVVGYVWMGVFLFGWSLFRWHNPWLGLIPGAVALAVVMVHAGQSQPIAIFFYVLFGLLLVMRSNLTALIGWWRAEGVTYPPLISLSFMRFTVLAVLLLMLVAWIAPVRSIPPPNLPDSLVRQFDWIGIQFEGLTGPLRGKRQIVPVHSYAPVLRFQRSIFQGGVGASDRELLSVTTDIPSLEGPFLLRGAVYGEYAVGGWKAGPSQPVAPPSDMEARVRERLEDGSLEGQLVSLMVTVEAKSVVGTVLFSLGQPVAADVASRITAPEGSLRTSTIFIPEREPVPLTDEEILTWVPEDAIGFTLDSSGQLLSVQLINDPEAALIDTLVMRPDEPLAEGESYEVLGLVQAASPDDLVDAGQAYPSWVTDQYLQLPASLPSRVGLFAYDIAVSAQSCDDSASPLFGNPCTDEVTPYDRAKAIESYLRQLPVAGTAGDIPPGVDPVDYFLFESQGGHFDLHASAMVVLLRAVGVPARIAVGFVLDEEDLDPRSGVYVVRDSNAYAWAEVYFPDHGWIPFSPAPDRPAVLIPELGEIPELDEVLDDPLDFLEDLLFEFDNPSGPEVELLDTSGSGSGTGYTTLIVLGIAALVAAVVGSLAFGWQRLVVGLPYPQQVWEKTVRLSSWAGRPPQPGQTPSEFTAHLKHTTREVSDISALADAYNRSRFGNREPSGEENERLRQLWPHLRASLLKNIIGRAWRRR